MPVLTLKQPVPLGEEMITELNVKWNARALKDYSLPMQADGTVLYQPYQLASVGVAMAGQPKPVLDGLGPEDFNALAQMVLSFFGTGQTTGKST